MGRIMRPLGGQAPLTKHVDPSVVHTSGLLHQGEMTILEDAAAWSRMLGPGRLRGGGYPNGLSGSMIALWPRTTSRAGAPDDMTGAYDIGVGA
jgi:hypothetical protein